MTRAKKIVGVCLIRNEDRFLETVLRNVLEFCDEILVADHGSTDGSHEIVAQLAAQSGKVKYRRIEEPGQSHEWIACLAGTPTWIFGVDGDEIYDPVRLRDFRKRLLSEEFEKVWQVLGNVLHCTKLEAETATGYLARPSRSMTKLYNFSLIESWNGPCSERLHGGTIKMRQGSSLEDRCRLDDTESFESSPFRCLHTVFLPRSSLDRKDARMRLNIADWLALSWPMRVFAGLRGRLGFPVQSRTKREYYRRGKLVTYPTKPFFESPDAT